MGPLNSNQRKYFLYFGIIFLIVGISVGGYFLFFQAKPSIAMVSGTEYISNEDGQIIARLHDANDAPIESASCVVSVLYPDKTFFIVDRTMTATAVPGNYYVSFTTPAATGIYEENIRCNARGKTLYISSSFHVSAGLNLVAEVFKAQQDQYQKIMTDFLTTQEMVQSNLGNVSQRLDNLELRLNKSIEDNQRDMLEKWFKLGAAMQNIFSNSSY